MKISLSTGSLYIYPLRTTLAMAKRAGFDGVELVINPEVDLRGGEYARRLGEEFELPVLTLHPPLYEYRGWDHVYKSYAPYLARAMKAAQAAGADLVVVHMPKARAYSDWVGAPFIDRLGEMRGEMERSGVRLALENMGRGGPRDDGYILRTLREVRELADRFDLPLTLDTTHVGTMGGDILQALEIFGDRLANVHFSDLKRVGPFVESQPELHSFLKQHQLPGEGWLPLREFLAALRARNFEGTLTYELSPTALQIWSPKRAEAELVRVVEFARGEDEKDPPDFQRVEWERNGED